MKILIAGISGLIGTALRRHFLEKGDKVVGLTRDPNKADNENLFAWDPLNGSIDERALHGVDGVINLAGENIAQGRWTKKRKLQLINSRLFSTQLLVKTIEESRPATAWMINASAIGIYGDCGDDLVTEATEPAEEFLAKLVEDWEEQLSPLRQLATRTVCLRLGLVLSTKGGALKKMLPAFKLGGGAILGSGNQWVPWISLTDVIGAIDWIIKNHKMAGAYNCVSPNPVQFNEFARSLGKSVNRPVLLKIPSGVVKLLFGEMGDATLLSSCKVQPQRLLDSGFKFGTPLLEDALKLELSH